MVTGEVGSRLFQRTEYFLDALRGRHPYGLPMKKEGPLFTWCLTWWFLRQRLRSIPMNDFRNESFNRINTQGLRALLACETQNKNSATDGGNEMYTSAKKLITMCNTWMGSQHTAKRVTTTNSIRMTRWFRFLLVLDACSAGWSPSRAAVVLLSFLMMNADKTAMANKGKT